MKEFDFDDIGKKTPYRTPDNFFEDMQQKVMERTCGKRRPKHRLRMLFASAVAAAAVLAAILFVPPFFEEGDPATGTSNMLAIETGSNDSADKWIDELSDEELEELISFSDNDIFLN